MKLRYRVIILGMLSLARVGQAAPPVTFEVLDPVRPDETLLLFGADVTKTATAEGLRLPDTRVSSPPAAVNHGVSGKTQKLEILQASDLSAKVLIPADWKQGIYAVRLHNADGSGEWQFVNRPQLWWQISGDGGRASPGGELRVFGKNLGAKSRVWLVGAKGVAREIPVKLAREFDVTAELPANLPVGTYRVWLHNGFGGQAGFGEPLALEVDAVASWPTTVFDVTQYGATHDGQRDDTEAIRQALKAAEANGGGVVLLPSGTYIVTSKLLVPKRTILRGEKRESVWIKVPVYWPAYPNKLAELDTVIAGNGDFGVENLSIVAQPVRRIIAAPDLAPLYGLGMARLPAALPTADRVHLRNLRIQHLYYSHGLNDKDPRRSIAEGPSTIVVNGADFSLEDCDIVSAGMPIQILEATRARICRNALRTGRNGWYGLWNFSQGLFEGNDISAADLEGSYGGVQGNAVELFFRNNHWHDAYGDDREALTFDTPYHPAWIGHASAIGPTLTFQSPGNLTWPPEPNYPKDLFAVIAGGRGLGQAVPVSKITDNGVILERPFKVTPDVDSVIAVVARKSRVIITENLVEDASVAFQLYSQSHEFIVVHNRSVRTGGSYARAGHWLDSTNRYRYWYALFNQWFDNSYEEGMAYEQGPWPFGFIGINVARATDDKVTPAIGNRFSGNRADGSTRIGLSNRESSMKERICPLGLDMLFEANEMTGHTKGIVIDEGFSGTLLRKNQGTDGK